VSEVIAHQSSIDTRLKLGLQSTEYFDVIRAVISLGITCIKKPLESNLSGATLKGNKVKIIFVNSAKTLGHQNFTIAHEIYHCLYDENLTSRACQTEVLNGDSANEQIANSFATYLLMPEDGIYHQLRLRGKVGPRLKLEDIVGLEQYFGVSRRSICWRLEDLVLITRSDSDAFNYHVIQGVRNLGKDIQLYQPTNDSIIISDYVAKAREALDRGLITHSRFDELLAGAGLNQDLSDELDDTIIVD
jgi:Zn-dependent peptidase ImmA (M78 family)